MINKQCFELNWKQIRIQTPKWWSLMSENDLNKVEKAQIKLDKYVTLLQVKYGYTREQAKVELGKQIAAHGAEITASAAV